jgi:hypothetical protein
LSVIIRKLIPGIQGKPGKDGRDGIGKDGKSGLDGEPGKRGPKGLSAFEVAKKNGFVGNEVEWLRSLKGPPGSSGFSTVATNPAASGIPQLLADPVSPEPESAWVLQSISAPGGSPLGLLLALTTPATYAYQLSYRTLQNTTVRVVLA